MVIVHIFFMVNEEMVDNGSIWFYFNIYSSFKYNHVKKQTFQKVQNITKLISAINLSMQTIPVLELGLCIKWYSTRVLK